MGRLRGADVLARSLARGGVDHVFALSGNQVMSVFDAVPDAGLSLTHVRHEAAAVHMADAWGRLTGRPGIALVTAGPGFANALSALFVASAAESPLVLLSGQAPAARFGQGAFQKLDQTGMAGPVAKASWTVHAADELGESIAGAFRTAVTGRPGPVHLSLPADVLEAAVDSPADPLPQAEHFLPEDRSLEPVVADRILATLHAAMRPLIVGGPALRRGPASGRLSRLSEVTGAPAIAMDSPRGVRDPGLGAFADVLPEADVLLLIGKKVDFMLGFGESPPLGADCRLMQVDPEPSVLEQSRQVLRDQARLPEAAVADPLPTLEGLLERSDRWTWPKTDWRERVHSAAAYRPPEWQDAGSPAEGPLHPLDVCRQVRPYLEEAHQAVFISDGGEFGQWAQAGLDAPVRVINGPSGAIGSAIPFVLAARLAYPEARIAATLGDGTFGFHALEFDTAVRYELPFVAVVGNDACWNAEYQLQLARYGKERAVGCTLEPSRYDRLVDALGGYGESVANPAELDPALDRAFRSGRPSCVNVAISRELAPVVRFPA